MDGCILCTCLCADQPSVGRYEGWPLRPGGEALGKARPRRCFQAAEQDYAPATLPLHSGVCVCMRAGVRVRVCVCVCVCAFFFFCLNMGWGCWLTIYFLSCARNMPAFPWCLPTVHYTILTNPLAVVAFFTRARSGRVAVKVGGASELVFVVRVIVMVIICACFALSSPVMGGEFHPPITSSCTITCRSLACLLSTSPVCVCLSLSLCLPLPTCFPHVHNNTRYDISDRN